MNETTSSPASANPRPAGRRWPLVPLLLVLAMLLLAVFGDRGLLRAVQYRRQKEALEAELRQLEEANAALRKEIAALRSDRRTIEGIARKELGMVRKDELIYQFPSRSPVPQTPAATTAAPPADPVAPQ